MGCEPLHTKQHLLQLLVLTLRLNKQMEFPRVDTHWHWNCCCHQAIPISVVLLTKVIFIFFCVSWTWLLSWRDYFRKFCGLWRCLCSLWTFFALKGLAQLVSVEIVWQTVSHFDVVLVDTLFSIKSLVAQSHDTSCLLNVVGALTRNSCSLIIQKYSGWHVDSYIMHQLNLLFSVSDNRQVSMCCLYPVHDCIPISFMDFCLSCGWWCTVSGTVILDAKALWSYFLTPVAAFSSPKKSSRSQFTLLSSSYISDLWVWTNQENACKCSPLCHLDVMSFSSLILFDHYVPWIRTLCQRSNFHNKIFQHHIW